MPIGSLKNGTAYGGVQAEVIKYETWKLFNFLRNLFEIYLNGEVPQTWKMGFISVINKKKKETMNAKIIKE